MHVKSFLFSALFFPGLLAGLSSSSSYAHSGRTNSSGCHTNHGTGDYHCHNGGSSRSGASSPSPSAGSSDMAAWTVISVGDGDTIRVERNGQITTARLGCIDLSRPQRLQRIPGRGFTLFIDSTTMSFFRVHV